jgi:hypothetical protein
MQANKAETIKEFIARGGVVESVQDYLARGGSVKKVDPGVSEKAISVTKKTTSSGEPATILSLEEADLYYGVPKKSSVKKKTKTKTNNLVDLLPEELKKKFMAKFNDGDLNGQES